MEIKGTNEIEVKHFDTIVRHCCPISKELFFLASKILLTSFLLNILFLTLNELNFLGNEDSSDINTLLMYAFVLLTPGILEILFFESNADKVERMHGELDKQVRNLSSFYEFEQNIDINTSESEQAKQGYIKVCCMCCCGCLKCVCDENDHCCYTLKEEDKDGHKYFTSKPFNLCDAHNAVDDEQIIENVENV
jgi:hypothetical protein